MYTAKNARKESSEKAKQKGKLLDALQLAWFVFCIKLAVKRGRDKIDFSYRARPNVVKKLREERGYLVTYACGGTYIYW